MKYLLVIEGDTNDGDYVTENTIITEKDLEEIKPIVKAIKAYTKKNKDEHNWFTQESQNDTAEEKYSDIYETKAFKKFENYVPYGEYGVHTIESVVVSPSAKIQKLL